MRSFPDQTTSVPPEAAGAPAPGASAIAPPPPSDDEVRAVEAALEHDLSAIADIRLRLSDRLTVTSASVGRASDLPFAGDDLLGRSVGEVIGQLAPEVNELIDRALATGAPQSFSFMSADHERWLSAKLGVSPNGDVLLAARDVTAEHNLQRELEHRAYHDSLTELPNRLRLNDELDAVLGRRPVRAAILVIDLDGFKLINDVAGHAAGDELLRAFAHRLRSAVRRDDMVARIAGDEFAVLLSNIDCTEQAIAAAEHLQRELGEPFPIEGELSVQSGIGVTLVTADDTVADVMRRASVALYAAKRQGSDSIASFDSQLFEAMKQRHGLVRDLERAIAAGEVRAAYQPIVDLHSGDVCAVEALARWTSPDGEAVSPDVFIRAAEDNGLIVPLFDHMLRASIADATPWFAVIADLALHVNVSAVQMRQAGLGEAIAEAIADGGVAPGNICVEITESVFALDLPVTKRNLDELVDLGVSICLDDFGTGYSSLSYLQRFAPSMLKLDRTFVHEMSKTGDPRLARAILGLARDLEIQAVAEGIETGEQWRALRDLGWRLGQGFLMSRPVPPDGFGELLGRALLPVG